MIYLDTSVVLAWLLAEERRPADAFFGRDLAASRLLQYELWVRLNARGRRDLLAETVPALLERVWFLELNASTLERLQEPFPVGVKTLDAIHLAAALILRRSSPRLAIATLDSRFAQAATALGFPLAEL